MKVNRETGSLFVVAAAAALAEMADMATTREEYADFVADKVFLWRISANRVTRLAEDSSE